MTLFKKIIALENEAENFGFKWEKVEQIMAQIHSECAEITVHLQNPTEDSTQVSLQEEIGDLLHAVFSLCVFCKLSPHETLEKALTKFERRLQAVKQIANEQKLTTLNGHEFNELMEIWEQAKKMVG